MSSALVWHLIRDNNSFLVKRGRTNRNGAVQFSSEPGNLLNVNSYKYSGIANDKVVGVSNDLNLSSKDGKNNNKPAKWNTNTQLNLNKGKSGKKVAEVVSKTRPDLSSAAKHRYNKLARASAIKRGLSKKVVKSTPRK